MTRWPIVVLSLLLGATNGVRAQEDRAVLVLPAKVPAFEAIEAGIREEVRGRVELRVLLATDFAGRPEGLIEAALAEKPVVIMPLGTGLSQAFIAQMETRELPPVIGIAVTNPADVLAADQLDPPRDIKATIIPDGPPSIYADTAHLIASLVPNAKRVSTVFNPGEANSLTNRDRIREEAQRHGWEFLEKPITSPEDVETVARALLQDNPDVIWISKDKIMTSQPGRLIELAHQAGVPVFASDAGTVETFHAVGTQSVSFQQLGRFIGQRLLEVAGGADVREMSIATVDRTTIFLSRPALRTLGMSVPEEIASAAHFYGAATDAVPRTSATAWIVMILVLGAVIVIVVVVAAKRRQTAPPAQG